MLPLVLLHVYTYVFKCVYLFISRRITSDLHPNSLHSTNSASSQWFWLLFDSDLTPAGKNLLDGAYACFGYTTEGADFLKDVREGDIISKATVVSGKDNLIMPK